MFFFEINTSCHKLPASKRSERSVVWPCRELGNCHQPSGKQTGLWASSLSNKLEITENTPEITYWMYCCHVDLQGYFQLFWHVYKHKTSCQTVAVVGGRIFCWNDGTFGRQLSSTLPLLTTICKRKKKRIKRLRGLKPSTSAVLIVLSKSKCSHRINNWKSDESLNVPTVLTLPLPLVPLERNCPHHLKDFFEIPAKF